MTNSQTNSRLTRALKLLDLCLSSRELSYASIPHVIAAEALIKMALEMQDAYTGNS